MSSIKSAEAIARAKATAVTSDYTVLQDGKSSVALVSMVAANSSPCSQKHQSGHLGGADAT